MTIKYYHKHLSKSYCGRLCLHSQLLTGPSLLAWDHTSLNFLPQRSFAPHFPVFTPLLRQTFPQPLSHVCSLSLTHSLGHGASETFLPKVESWPKLLNVVCTEKLGGIPSNYHFSNLVPKVFRVSQLWNWIIIGRSSPSSMCHQITAKVTVAISITYQHFKA